MEWVRSSYAKDVEASDKVMTKTSGTALEHARPFWAAIDTVGGVVSEATSKYSLSSFQSP